MKPPLHSREDINRTALRADFIASCVMPLVVMLWSIGYSIALCIVLAVMDALGLIAADENSTLIGVLFLVGFFGGGMYLSSIALRWTIRRFGVVCPNCESPVGGSHRHRKRIGKGFCPICEKTLIDSGSQ